MAKNDRASLGIGGKQTKDISNDANTKTVMQRAESMPSSSGSDQAKYAYAVSLASDDMGDDLDTDSLEFLDTVDSYYAQMDPTMSASELRGENPFGTAVRNVRMGIDGANDLLGDLLKGTWDFGAGALGGLVGSGAELLGVEDAAEDWSQAARDFLSDDAADTITSIGTDIAVAAIPGVGLPLSVAKGLVENSDDIYEAVTGRDDITLQQLSDNQRLGRGLSGTLGAVLSALPAVGKARNVVKAGSKINDIKNVSDAAGTALDAAEHIKKAGMIPKVSMDDLAAVKSGASQIIPGSELDTIVQKYMPKASDGLYDKAVKGAKDFATGSAEGVKASGSGFREGVRNLLSGDDFGNPLKRFASGYGRGSAGTYRDAMADNARGRISKDAEKAVENAAPIRNFVGDKIGDNFIGNALKGSAQNKGAKKAAKMMANIAEDGTIDPSLIYRTNPLSRLGMPVLNTAAGFPMAFLNYMGSTGGDFEDFVNDMQGQNLASYLIPAVAGGVLGNGAAHRLGLSNISGRMGNQPSMMIAANNLGDLFNGYGQQAAATPDEIIDALAAMPEEDADEQK